MLRARNGRYLRNNDEDIITNNRITIPIPKFKYIFILVGLFICLFPWLMIISNLDLKSNLEYFKGLICHNTISNLKKSTVRNGEEEYL